MFSQKEKITIWEQLKRDNPLYNTFIYVTKKLEDFVRTELNSFKSEYDKRIEETLSELSAYDGEDGEDYILTEEDKKHIASLVVVPSVEKKTIEKRTEIIREQPIVTEITRVTNEIKEVSKYETVDQILDKINSKEGGIEMSSIKGLVNRLIYLEKKIRKNKYLSGSGATASTTGSGSLTVETPVGAVNGVNLVYTVTTEPKFILADGMNRIDGFGYTYSAGTVTFDSNIPPKHFIRSFY